MERDGSEAAFGAKVTESVGAPALRRGNVSGDQRHHRSAHHDTEARNLAGGEHVGDGTTSRTTRVLAHRVEIETDTQVQLVADRVAVLDLEGTDDSTSLSGE